MISIPAGLARMNFPAFLLATFIGAYLWCSLLIGAGTLLGHEWPLISFYVKQWFPALVLIGLLALAAYFMISRKSRSVAAPQ
jgi:membrane protein DedA with SNARE-associated domain